MDRARRQHVEQVSRHRFVAGWGPKRSATVVPAPLRYWQYRPGGPLAAVLALTVVAVWLALFAWTGGWPAARGELPLALAAGAALYALSTGRLTVSDSGMSFDVAGRRTDPATVLPSALVQEVRAGGAPPEWPRPADRGGWWPGRTRVAVRYRAEDGAAAVTLRVRDPEAFADAVGVPLSR
ncbi:hypothetical protein [Blastococcus xanthinilyticus]|uniref:Uncharacterized protein n=1 Tax=Blastococcus xanthinilyticus TaxID=1564164 RepID=A0A5S5CUT2_9ACTN|nr:hypothetical protein [Blastococcus xanthinilyticus]TYP87483.1 hypothetical protein BD833_10671 [Blastococcus xanthinilyticus]